MTTQFEKARENSNNCFFKVDSTEISHYKEFYLTLQKKIGDLVALTSRRNQVELKNVFTAALHGLVTSESVVASTIIINYQFILNKNNIIYYNVNFFDFVFELIIAYS